MIRKPPSFSLADMGEAASTDHIKRVESELAKEDTLLANMIQQAPGMIGMAFMFIITIMIGIWLQPWFDAAGLQAFGESGSTEVRWIALELVAIFAFTFMILWLAKNHLQHVIKYGILFVLFLALCYTTVPGAHILLVPEVETEKFVFTESESIDEELFSVTSDGSMITHKAVYRDSIENHSFIVSKRAVDTSLEWSMEFDSYPGTPDQFGVSEGIFGYTINNNKWIWTLDKDTGEILSKYACFEYDGWNGTAVDSTPMMSLDSCVSVLEVIENPDAETNQSKGALYVLTSGNTIVRQEIFADAYIPSNVSDEEIGFHRHAAEWVYPPIMQQGNTHMNLQYDEDSLLLATDKGAVMIKLEENSASTGSDGVTPDFLHDESTVEWFYSPDDGDSLTTLNIVTNPWAKGEQLIMAGTERGEVIAWVIDDDSDGNFSKEKRFKGGDSFEGPIAYISNFDLDESDGDEIWIADGDGIHGLFYDSLIEYVTIDVELENDSIFTVDGFNITSIKKGDLLYVADTSENMAIGAGEFDPDTMYNAYGIQWDNTAFLVGIGLAILLMTALIIRPEWYIVNTVGVLVGAGVIVMLGVTFVPTLIVIFMVLAAIYDAWAVYRSKHMLDLADTMIGLNLPILLVAPQESGYSMLDEKDTIRPVENQQNTNFAPTPSESPKKVVKRKKPKEAMFMGLGDVIFPGMLVISCVNYISDSGLAVGISALIGGLIGYLVLMTYVASGRPQAGLPLLNGGAILGYIIGGLIFVGSAAFSFGISF